MKITAIIAEYNPFHKGHEYQINEAKKVTGADAVLVVMSGDFTQRGTPAITDKHLRAKMALLGGADAVIELPSCYACASAEYFADGAIALLDSLGCIDSICFGSECGDINILRAVAEVLLNEPAPFKEVFQTEIKAGKSYPVARNRALVACVPHFAENENIIGSPNNILGIEYIKSILKRKSKIQPYTILRLGADYHSYRLDQTFSSALALRQSLDIQGDLSMIETQVPAGTYEILKEEQGKSYPIYPRDFSSRLKYKLLLEQNDGYSSFVDINQDLSDRIEKHMFDTTDYEQLCDILKTKNYTYARISRLLCHILLDLRKEDLDDYMNEGTVFYCRVLGFRESFKETLGLIAKSSRVPLITKVSDGKKLEDPYGQSQFNQDILVSHLYQSVVSEKFDQPFKNEYKRQVIIV